jgi:RNA polymerase sigma-70 factor (ECF subfamily)
MPLRALSDEALLDEWRKRTDADRDALIDELFGRHYERVARWCLRFTGDREQAADLAQDVFLKAHRHLDSFRGASRFSTWLYTIVRNESMTRIERSISPIDKDEVIAEVASLDPAPDELIARNERGARLREFLIATLEPLERRVFVLHYGDEVPLDAITRLLRLDNPSGAKAYIVSARRKLARATQRLRSRGGTL